MRAPLLSRGCVAKTRVAQALGLPCGLCHVEKGLGYICIHAVDWLRPAMSGAGPARRRSCAGLTGGRGGSVPPQREGFEYESARPVICSSADRGIRVKKGEGPARSKEFVASSRRDIRPDKLSIITQGHSSARLLTARGRLPQAPGIDLYSRHGPCLWPLAPRSGVWQNMEFRRPGLFFTDSRRVWTTATNDLGLVDSPEGIRRLYAEDP